MPFFLIILERLLCSFLNPLDPGSGFRWLEVCLLSALVVSLRNVMVMALASLKATEVRQKAHSVLSFSCLVAPQI